MGLRVHVFLPVIAVLFGFQAKATDPGCAGKLHGVYELGRYVEVPAVEKIAQSRAKELFLYTNNDSVHSQLNVESRDGYVAVRDESVAGFVVYEHHPTHLLITAIAVSEGFERQGVGRDLVERVVETAQGLGEVRVIVALDSPVADFFHRLGFEDADILRQHFNRQTTSGVLLKLKTHSDQQRQMQPVERVEPKRVAVAVALKPATLEFLRQIDPTLANAD